ncbi:hypothetical protein [Endozoicomonas arenosclerae]|uniref:hypothetical protein n=1 Tax=Endozoicomonas arenosclerae TaxID=1633495 RepID=UPI000AC1CDF4|nr:hypothetical protein [Endozoicomonas arenosclerae]
MQYLLFLTLFFSSFTFSNTSFLEKPKNVQKHKQYCLSKNPPTHRAKFVFEELCLYGKNGCSNTLDKESFEVLCTLNKVSDCYAQKAWQSRNQYFNLDNSLKINNIKKTTKIKNGKATYTICAYYIPRT